MTPRSSHRVMVSRPAARAATALLGVALAAGDARAHDGRPIEPHDLWSAWSWEPGTLLALAVTGALYLRGARALRRRAGRDVRPRRSLAFWTGWAVLAVALLSPLHALGGALFSAHMVQHELLIALAAPLLVMGAPLVPALWSLPPSWRRRLGAAARTTPVRGAWRALTHPLVAFALQGAALWAWHLPGPYQATLRSEAAHVLQHASFLLTALLFWWTILHHRRAGGGAAFVSLFVTALHTGALGALLTLTDGPWYPAYGRSAWAWGLTALEDQQLAGLVMWIPACLAYLVAALWIAARWLVEPGGRATARRASGAAAAAVLLLVMLACTPDYGDHDAREAAMLTDGGDPERGRAAIRRHGCGSCHSIAGVRGADALVGPPLTGIAERAYIAGVVTNTPDNLRRWIRDPQGVDPRTAMPNLGVTDAEARDIAAYLYALR